MKTKPFIAICLLVLGGLTVSRVNAGTGVEDTIRKAVRNVLPDVTVDSITPAPIPGLSEVLIGAKLFYVSNDGKYILEGTLIDLATRTDLSEKRLSSVRQALIDKVSEKDMIIFPASKPRHTLTVFTDIDCGYCRKLHSDIDKYNDEGITVRYLPFPRSGPDTPSYYKAVSVWCSDDRQAALTRAKAGQDVPNTTCDNPVRASLALGHKLGVNGTPALILEDGHLLPGYVPPKKLADVLDHGL